MNGKVLQSSIRVSFFLIAASAVLLLCGCSPVGPNYVRPETTMPDAWHTPLQRGLTEQAMDPNLLASWWTTLNDPELTELITRAAVGNLDVKEARARVRQARASRAVAEAELFPALNVSGSKMWTRSSSDSGTGETTHLYSSAFDAGWELDIFGGVRRSIEAADAEYQASEEDLRDVLVTLVSEVALNYIEVRTYQTRLATVQENLQTQTETYQLTDWRCQAGLSDELAVQQARYSLESTRSQVPTLQTGLEEAMNRIAVLLGEQPGSVHANLASGRPMPVLPSDIAVGVPAETIRRRPDIRRAERELAAQTAKVGVAAAELYPRFSLNGSIGIEAVSLNKLAANVSTPSDWVLQGGPQVTWNVFDAGAIRRTINVQSAIQEQKLIQYEAAVLAVLEEVENILVAYANEHQKNNSLRQAAQAAQQAVELARFEYEAGLTDFSNVLEAQRSLLSFQDQRVESDGTMVSNLIRLYKALGGGWSSLMEVAQSDINRSVENK